jgi:RNA polymerase sigma-70 factor (ECF subfamily)
MDVRIVKAVAGDQSALSELLLDHHDALVARLRARIPPSRQAAIDPEDILQETYVDVFRGIRSFQPRSDHAFANWLRSIAEHRLLDAIRGQQAQKRGGVRHRVPNQMARSSDSLVNLLDLITSASTTPSRKLARQEGLAALQIHLASLPQEYREVIELRHLQGLSREAVAERLGRSADEVRGLLYRALKKLRDALGQSSLYLTRK